MRLLILAFCFALAITSCQQTIKKPEDLLAVATQLNKGMEEAFSRGKLLAVADFYGADAYMLSPGRNTIQGREVINKYWQRFKSPIDWKLDIIKVSKVETELYETTYWQEMSDKPPHWDKDHIKIGENEKVFYQLGHSKLVYEREDGTHNISHVDFILVWKKYADGKYKIFIDTYH